MIRIVFLPTDNDVAPREGRVSRNDNDYQGPAAGRVAPREGRVSRNIFASVVFQTPAVAPREGRVSRNPVGRVDYYLHGGRAPRGACE